MKKRILALIMVMAMLLSSVAVFASDEEAVKLTDEEITLPVYF